MELDDHRALLVAALPDHVDGAGDLADTPDLNALVNYVCEQARFAREAPGGESSQAVSVLVGLEVLPPPSLSEDATRILGSSNRITDALARVAIEEGCPDELDAYAQSARALDELGGLETSFVWVDPTRPEDQDYLFYLVAMASIFPEARPEIWDIANRSASAAFFSQVCTELQVVATKTGTDAEYIELLTAIDELINQSDLPTALRSEMTSNVAVAFLPAAFWCGAEYSKVTAVFDGWNRSSLQELATTFQDGRDE